MSGPEIDTAEIRAEMGAVGPADISARARRMILDLADALDAAQAEVAYHKGENEIWARCAKTWKPGNRALVARAETAERQVAAARALCDEETRECRTVPCARCEFAERITASLDGTAPPAARVEYDKDPQSAHARDRRSVGYDDDRTAPPAAPGRCCVEGFQDDCCAGIWCVECDHPDHPSTATVGDPLASLRTEVAAGRVTVWCPCYGTPEPDGSWMPPDDEHADGCVIDWMKAKEAAAPPTHAFQMPPLDWARQRGHEPCGHLTDPDNPFSHCRKTADDAVHGGAA